MTALPCKHLSVSIAKPFERVNAFLSDPANWKLWASGLGEMQFDTATGAWTAQQESGLARIDFTPRMRSGFWIIASRCPMAAW